MIDDELVKVRAVGECRQLARDASENRVPNSSMSIIIFPYLPIFSHIFPYFPLRSLMFPYEVSSTGGLRHTFSGTRPLGGMMVAMVAMVADVNLVDPTSGTWYKIL